MDLANRFTTDISPFQPTAVDPFLNFDVRFCLELQVALASVFAIVIFYRPLNQIPH